jgi:uncharacterized protein YjbI with pentapeptide repeats
VSPRSRNVPPATISIAQGGAQAADLTVRQVTEALFRAHSDEPPDFSRKDLSFLDLSGLDFKRANLAGANMYGVDLSDANLSGANLSGATLDHTIIIRTNFAGANLSGASVFAPAAFSSLEPSRAETPNFAGADLSGARIMARLSQAEMSSASFAHARMGIARDQLKTAVRNDLSGCGLSGADFSGRISKWWSLPSRG